MINLQKEKKKWWPVWQNIEYFKSSITQKESVRKEYLGTDKTFNKCVVEINHGITMRWLASFSVFQSFRVETHKASVIRQDV